MTASEWTSSTNPGKMFLFLRDNAPASDRKLRLIAAAAASSVYNLMDDDRSREAVRVAEAVADATMEDGEWARARAATEAVYAEAEEETDAAADGASARDEVAVWRLRVAECSAAVAHATLDLSAESAASKAVRLALSAEELSQQAGMGTDNGGTAGVGIRRFLAAALRDLFGNPFHPLPFDPSWRTEAVVSLARGVYEERLFERLPVLADALEDAGCSDEAVLAHCRGGGLHVRGCWVVDAVLGKA